MNHSEDLVGGRLVKGLVGSASDFADGAVKLVESNLAVSVDVELSEANL